MDEINSLRQQLGAAQFLANSLRTQLQRAEEAHAAAQPVQSRRAPRSLPQGGTLHNAPNGNIDPELARRQGTLSNDGTNSNAMETAHVGHHGPRQNSNRAGQETESDTPPVAESGEYPVPEGMTLPSLTLKTIYPSLADVKLAVEAHAMAQGWTVSVKKRDRLRILTGCRKTPLCTYHARAETCAAGARISAYNPIHTCLNAPIPEVAKRQKISKLNFLREEVPKLMHIDQTTKPRNIQEMVFQHFGKRPTLAQCGKLKVPKRTKRPQVQTCSQCGVVGHNKLTCTGVGNSIPGAGPELQSFSRDARRSAGWHLKNRRVTQIASGETVVTNE